MGVIYFYIKLGGIAEAWLLSLYRDRSFFYAFKLPADYFLFDTYTEGMYGGSGKTFDYSILKEVFDKMDDKGCPEYFLAGGINIDNVEMICNSVKELKYPPYCLDISSGVETAGKKDGKKIEQLIKIVKGCN